MNWCKHFQSLPDSAPDVNDELEEIDPVLTDISEGPLSKEEYKKLKESCLKERRVVKMEYQQK